MSASIASVVIRIHIIIRVTAKTSMGHHNEIHSGCDEDENGCTLELKFILGSLMCIETSRILIPGTRK